MRARAGVAVATMLAVAVLAGCGDRDGVDGDLTGGWASLPAAVGFVPEVGACHEDVSSPVGMIDYRPVPCHGSHRWETFHVDEFRGDEAERVTVPPVGSPEVQGAFRTCDAEAERFLGEDFRHGQLLLQVVLPRAAAWDGGSRWFRCDLAQWRDHDRQTVTAERTGSLRDALAGDSELRLGCFAPEFAEGEDWVEHMNPVDCDEPHNAEFAGVWRAPDTSYLDMNDEEDSARAHRECRRVVADFVGVPDDGDLRFRTGTIAWSLSEQEWEAGNRGIACYLWLSEHEVSESLAGAGEDGLPIR